jgi:hypothetical protein
MSDNFQPTQKLKIVSLEPKIIFVQQNDVSQNTEKSSENEDESVILAPLFIDPEQAIDDLSQLIDKVHDEFDNACKKLNLKWEAELELGMEFGVKFTAKLKISPKKE